MDEFTIRRGTTVKILCYGDSNTWGFSPVNGSRFSEDIRWPGVLRRCLGEGFTVMGVLCRELYGRCRPFMVVEDVIVDQAHRRRGIGTLLMRAIEQEAFRNQCSYIMLVTDATRREALGFYEHLGYHPDRYKACKMYLSTVE
jgi:GNAT superfamily N-acetyltransferase